MKSVVFLRTYSEMFHEVKASIKSCKERTNKIIIVIYSVLMNWHVFRQNSSFSLNTFTILISSRYKDTVQSVFRSVSSQILVLNCATRLYTRLSTLDIAYERIIRKSAAFRTSRAVVSFLTLAAELGDIHKTYNKLRYYCHNIVHRLIE